MSVLANQIIETITERIDAICKAVLSLSSHNKRPSFGDIEEQYQYLTVTDIAGLVGRLTTLTQRCKDNYDAATHTVSGEWQTAILVLQNSDTDNGEKQKELLLKVLHQFLESFSKSVDRTR